MRYRIDFTPNLVLGPNGSRQGGKEGTFYIYDSQNQCERMCYATTGKYAEQIRAALEHLNSENIDNANREKLRRRFLGI